VYWEFDLDNGWQSSFFLCASYSPEEDEDDDWASDFDEADVVAGPRMPEFARLYDPAWDETEGAIACNLRLIARTLGAFGRAAAASWTSPLPLCAGYHDQEILFRVVED
jgi:hypothetical protein